MCSQSQHSGDRVERTESTWQLTEPYSEFKDSLGYQWDPVSKKDQYAKGMPFNSFSFLSVKDLRPPDEDSHIVKIQRPNERSKRRESEVPRRASAAQGGFSFFQTVGYLTGDMKECKSWLKGKQVSKGEQGAVQRQPLLQPGQRSCSLSLSQQGQTQRGEVELTPGGHEPN